MPDRLERRRGLGCLATLGVVFLLGCTSPSSHRPPEDWIAWQARRHESVAGTNGWTTLAGLHWLDEGDNSAGSHPTNRVVLQVQGLPPLLGVFKRSGPSVSFIAAPGVDVRVDGRRVEALELTTDVSSTPTRLQIGRISIIALDRGPRVGLRVRDPETQARREFAGLRCFPYDPRWRLEGRFVPYPSARKLKVPDVTGGLQEFVSPGEIVFTAGGAVRRLAVALEPETPDFFIMFHDETSGHSTYPAGRFLYVTPPESGDRVTLDFNRSYTPPCGFTDFATCPFPPRQNWLPFAIEAGEVTPAGHH